MRIARQDGWALMSGPGFRVGTGYRFAPHGSVKFDTVTSHWLASHRHPQNLGRSLGFLDSSGYQESHGPTALEEKQG